MSVKFSSKALLLGAALLLGGCEYFRSHTAADILTDPFGPGTAKRADQSAIKIDSVKTPSSIVVCRSHQCAPAKLSMSKEYIYNSLLHLFDNNNYQKVLICQADSSAHTCLENYITIPIVAGITPTNAYIDSVRITDVIIGKSADKINLVLNYNLTYGGQTADCTPSKSVMFAKNINHVLLEDGGYSCKMTTIGQSSVKTVFAIDYIDLDYGYVGGHYSIGISGPAHGGDTGYMILRMPKNAYPLAPELTAPTQRSGSNSALATGSPASASSAVNNGRVQIFPLNKTSSAE